MEIFQFISSSKISTKKLLSPAFATKTIGYSSTLNGQQNFRKIKKNTFNMGLDSNTLLLNGSDSKYYGSDSKYYRSQQTGDVVYVCP